MRLRAILTDLDGTLLEPDGRLCPAGIAALRILGEKGISVLPVTSKTAAEVVWSLAELGLSGPGGFENGAGVVDRLGCVTLHPRALSMATLKAAAKALRSATGAPLRTIEEIDDAELAALTGLTGAGLTLARRRQATLPLMVDKEWDEHLQTAVPPEMLAVRGNRFLHLQGRHCKADAVNQLLAAAPGEGIVVVCGDSPNDLEMLRAADLAIIVPSSAGPHPVLRSALPAARVAPAPHGNGWAQAVQVLLDGGKEATGG